MATEIDQQFVEYVVKSLVGNPEAVKVDRSVDEKGVFLELTVDPEDLGRVIGKRGATAQSMRTLLRALGTKNDARYNLKIVDNGEPRPAASRSDDTSGPASQANDDSQSDDNSSNDASTNSSNDEVENVEADASEEAEAASKPAETPEEEDGDDLATKTRKELAELDDLDL